LVRQPANAVSSLAFVIVALLLLREPRSSARTTYMAALIVIGLGSAFYHASLTFAGQFVDVFGMYLIATFIITDNLSRSGRLTERKALTAFVAANAVLSIVLLALPLARRYLFALLIVYVLFLEIRARRSASIKATPLHAAIAALLAGFAIWILDITRVVCSPHSWIQGHALWHLLGAGSAWLFWKSRASQQGS
jgi:hypothetical protein